jgi:Aspartyl protease
VILPDKPSSAVLPIRDPILRPDLAVEAIVHGPDGKTAAIWMLLDSGATIGSLPAAVAADLRLVEEHTATMIAVNGVARTSLVVAPRLDLGALGLSRVAFLLNTLAGRANELGIAGQSVLARMPWEISWGRGLVTLGATPWVDGGEVTSVPLEPFAGGVEMVTARINGRPLKMMLVPWSRPFPKAPRTSSDSRQRPSPRTPSAGRPDRSGLIASTSPTSSSAPPSCGNNAS